MNLKEYIDSGILEAYALDELGDFNGFEHPELMAEKFPDVRQELLAINEALERYAIHHSVPPPPTSKPLLFATIDFLENIHNVADVDVPELNECSAVADYSAWLEEAAILPADFKGIHVKIIGNKPAMTTAIVWIESMAPEEVHHTKYEKFLILEGACAIAVENELYNFNPGDFFEIPLHKNHSVTVTSSIPCKVILQRITV